VAEAPLLVACSVFRPELEALVARGELDLPLRFFDSALHMEPARLAGCLDAAVAEAGGRCLLCYGDCDPGMRQRCRGGSARVPGPNCVAILVGRERWRAWMHEGAFVLLPEWARRWRELLMRLPGLDEEQTRDLLREQHRCLIYADTGVVPPPEAELAACSTHFGLPLRREAVDLAHLREALRALVAGDGHGL